MEFNFDLNQLTPKQKEGLIYGASLFGRCLGVVFVAYVLASMCSSVAMTFFIDSAMSKPRVVRGGNVMLDVSRIVNYRDIVRGIEGRNLFNKDGDFPEEADPGEAENTAEVGAFDENAPCIKTSLPIELLGTIYLGDTGSSLATVKERGYDVPDVYKAGDLVEGTQAKIHAVEQKRLVINNGGRKECLELTPPKSVTPGNSALPGGEIPPLAEGGCGNIQLKETYVLEQIGADGNKILESGRLIPVNQGGQMVGFKLIAMKSKSLFGRICLKNDDVITQVNDISMKQPDQGFALYDALQNERDIRISLLRGGKDPMTINVQIK